MRKISWLIRAIYQGAGAGRQDWVGVWMKTQILIHYLAPRKPRWDARPFQWQQHLVHSHTVQSISLIGNPSTRRRRFSYFNDQLSIFNPLLFNVVSLWLERRSSGCDPSWFLEIYVIGNEPFLRLHSFAFDCCKECCEYWGWVGVGAGRVEDKQYLPGLSVDCFSIRLKFWSSDWPHLHGKVL